jgi:hypothetical protein
MFSYAGQRARGPTPTTGNCTNPSRPGGLRSTPGGASRGWGQTGFVRGAVSRQGVDASGARPLRTWGYLKNTPPMPWGSGLTVSLPRDCPRPRPPGGGRPKIFCRPAPLVHMRHYRVQRPQYGAQHLEHVPRAGVKNY